MKTLSKRMLVYSLTAIMAASALVSCGDDKNDEKGKDISTAESSASSEASASEESPKESTVTLSYAISPLPTVNDITTNELTKWVEEQVNVKLDFMILPTASADAKTKLNLMVSSGQSLPDILGLGLDKSTINDYVKKGVLQDLTPYWNNPEYTTNMDSNISDILKETALKELPAEDGKIYSLFVGGSDPNAWNSCCDSRVWYNMEWLDKVGMERPTTTEEFYNVLKAFAEKDPNGNGKNDEVAMIGGTGWGQSVVPYLMNPFENCNPGRRYMSVKDGKIYPAFTTEKWKEGLEYIHRLVSEGLVDPLSFTQTGEQLKSFISFREGKAGVVPAGSYSVFSGVSTPEDKEKDILVYAALPPLKGPDGFQSICFTGGIDCSPYYFITKDCKNPDRAFILGDLFMGGECYMKAFVGSEGQNYVSSGPELDKCMDLPNGERPDYFIFNNVWGQQQNVNWASVGHPYIGDMPIVNGKKLYSGTPKTTFKVIQEQFTSEHEPLMPKEYIPSIRFTDEENEATADIRTAIDTYVNASIAEFATGTRPLSDWDNYLKELDKMGLQKYLEVYQAAYDRKAK